MSFSIRMLTPTWSRYHLSNVPGPVIDTGCGGKSSSGRPSEPSVWFTIPVSRTKGMSLRCMSGKFSRKSRMTAVTVIFCGGCSLSSQERPPQTPQRSTTLPLPGTPSQPRGKSSEPPPPPPPPEVEPDVEDPLRTTGAVRSSS